MLVLQRILQLSLRQYAYVATKLGKEGLLGAAQLLQVKISIGQVEKSMTDLPFDQHRTDAPPPNLWSDLGALQDLIGSQFIDSGEEVYGPAVLESKSVIGLYFSAHWCASTHSTASSVREM